LRRPTIVATARAIVASEGLDALSFRRLADRLDVSAPALYAHVSDKADLLGAIAEDERDALAARFDEVAGDAADRLRALARAYIGYAREQPQLYRLVATTPPGLRGSRALALLRDAAVADGYAHPARVAEAVWAAADGVAHVLQFGRPSAGGEDELLAAVLDPVLSGWPGGPGSR